MMQIKTAKQQRGLTLIEMMVALTIGLLVTAAISAVFYQTRVNSIQDQNTARMQENARFALSLLRSELLHGDFVANYINGGGGVSTAANPPATGVTNPPPAPAQDCTGNSNPWLYDIDPDQNRLFYMNDVTPTTAATAAYSCIDSTEFKDQTDILAIQRVLAAPTVAPAAADDTVYIRANADRAELFHNDGGGQPAFAGAAGTDWDDWEFLARIYYVNNDNELVRESLTTGAAPTMREEPLVDGIEAFHVEFGIDSSGNDGVADFYTADPTAAVISNVVSARIFVLARSPEEDPNYENDKTYRMGSEQLGPFNNDQIYRRVYTTTVNIRNSSYRAGLGQR